MGAGGMFLVLSLFEELVVSSFSAIALDAHFLTNDLVQG